MVSIILLKLIDGNRFNPRQNLINLYNLLKSPQIALIDITGLESKAISKIWRFLSFKVKNRRFLLILVYREICQLLESESTCQSTWSTWSIELCHQSKWFLWFLERNYFLNKWKVIRSIAIYYTTVRITNSSKNDHWII